MKEWHTEKNKARNRESKNRRSAQHGWPWVWGDAHKHILEPWCECTSFSVRTVQEKKVTCELYMSTHSVGYSRLLSAVNETYCNKQWIPVPRGIAWGRVPSPILLRRNGFCNFLTWLWEWFRTTRITLHCPFHGSSLSNCCWLGCRHYRSTEYLCRIDFGKKTVTAKLNNSEKFETVTA